MPPKISIIITTRNRAEHLRQTLESLGRCLSKSGFCISEVEIAMVV
jgi:glycosyltransferase involved in cell wall biosynthesis